MFCAAELLAGVHGAGAWCMVHGAGAWCMVHGALRQGVVRALRRSRLQ